MKGLISLLRSFSCRHMHNARRLPFSLHRLPQQSIRNASTNKGFLNNLIEKLKEESTRDQELKENIRKFREETAKLEKSDELQAVRDFYKKIEKELPTDSAEKLRDTLQFIRQKIKDEGQNFTKSESFRKSIESLSKAGLHIKGATQSLSESDIVKLALKGAEAVEEELKSDRASMYQPPSVLKTRHELVGKLEEKFYEADAESLGMVLHKDSKWYAAWQDFKDNNQYVQKFFDLKTQYEESDHLLVRSARFVTDRVSQLFGGLGSSSELQVVLDEITKMDPAFNVEGFMKFCRFTAIPNVLEAVVCGDLRVLKDWCYEAPYNVLATPWKQLKEVGYTAHSRVLDIHHLDLQMGKMMEQGPVLIITFQAQQISCIRDAGGAVREGDPHKVMRVTHVWAMCRDQTELHPLAAWRLLDIAMMPSEQWL